VYAVYRGVYFIKEQYIVIFLQKTVQLCIYSDMKCIYCRNKDTSVKNSRPVQKLLAVWRRRYCGACERTFTTTETAFADNLFVIKSSKKRQRFVYEKLFASIFSVLTSKKDSDNGDAALAARDMARSVIERILAKPEMGKDVSTSTLIELVYTHMKKVDLAYADHYIYYSPYRRKIGQKKGLIR
jgi:transcriptional repressor NrdR